MGEMMPPSQHAMRSYLRPFQIGEVVTVRRAFGAGTPHTFVVTTTQGSYMARITVGRSHAEARFEAALLRHVAARGVAVPRLLDAGKRGAVLELTARTHLSVFADAAGREVAIFEVTAEHARQVGRLLAELHLAGRGLGRRRRNPGDPERMARLAAHCHGGPPGSGLARDLQALVAELSRHRWARELPRGTVHGNFTVGRARFRRGMLAGVVDFTRACVAPLIYDLAAALSDWAFAHDTFVPARAAALVAGYEELRPLRPIEKGALYEFTRFCCAARALRCIHAFELQPQDGAGPNYCDYRHFLLRLAALMALGPTEFWGRVGSRIGPSYVAPTCSPGRAPTGR